MKFILVLSFISLFLSIAHITHSATRSTFGGGYGGYGGFNTIRGHHKPKAKVDDRLYFFDGLFLPGTPFPLVGGQYAGTYALNPVPGLVPLPPAIVPGKDKGGKPSYTGPAPDMGQMPPIPGQLPPTQGQSQSQFPQVPPPSMGQNLFAPSQLQMMPQIPQNVFAADPYANAAPPARMAEPTGQIPQAQNQIPQTQYPQTQSQAQNQIPQTQYPQAQAQSQIPQYPQSQSQIPQAPATPQVPPQQQVPYDKDKAKGGAAFVTAPVPLPALIDVPPPLLGYPKRAGAFDRGLGARYGLGSLHNPVLVGNQYEYGPLAGAEIFGIEPHYSPFAGFGYGALGYRGSPAIDFINSATDIYAYPDIMESLPVLEQQPLVQATAWANGQIVGELYPQFGQLAYPAYSQFANIPVPVPY